MPGCRALCVASIFFHFSAESRTPIPQSEFYILQFPYVPSTALTGPWKGHALLLLVYAPFFHLGTWNYLFIFIITGCSGKFTCFKISPYF